jgi:uridine kinase
LLILVYTNIKGHELHRDSSKLTPTPFIVGIAGPSGCGKTALANGLVGCLADLRPVVLSLDSYYHDMGDIPLEERAKANFDLPEAIDSNLLTSQLSQLAEGESILKPIYQFDTHTRAAESEKVNPGQLIILEGLFALYWPEVISLLGTSIYIDADEGLCLARRLARDVSERGRTKASVLAQYENTVKPCRERFVIPTRESADLILDGGETLESVLKKALEHIKQYIPA